MVTRCANAETAGPELKAAVDYTVAQCMEYELQQRDLEGAVKEGE